MVKPLKGKFKGLSISKIIVISIMIIFDHYQVDHDYEEDQS